MVSPEPASSRGLRAASIYRKVDLCCGSPAALCRELPRLARMGQQHRRQPYCRGIFHLDCAINRTDPVCHLDSWEQAHSDSVYRLPYAECWEGGYSPTEEEQGPTKPLLSS